MNKDQIEELVKHWFSCWETGQLHELPLAGNFRHTSPFGTIEGRQAYLALVKHNETKFLGYSFEIHDIIIGEDNACVRYTGKQDDFTLDVSEWYYVKNDLISEIVAYYHIGDIRGDRILDN
jgi:hypothetical protein